MKGGNYMDNKGKTSTGTILVGVALVFVVALIFLGFGGPTTPALTVITPAGTGAIAGAAPADLLSATDCADDVSTGKFDIRDGKVRTTRPDVNADVEFSSGKSLPAINNIDAGGTFTGRVGAGYITHLREDTSTGTSTTDFYYTTVTGNMNCGTEEIGGVMYKEGTLGWTIINDDGTTLNTANQGSAQALAAGEAKNLTFRLDSNTVNTVFGNPQSPIGLLMVVDYNNIAYQNIELRAHPNQPGFNFKESSVPKTYSNNQLRQVAFEVDASSSPAGWVGALGDFDQLMFFLHVQAASDQGPNVSAGGCHGGGAGQDINITVYDPTWSPNDDTGTFELGYVDTDNAGTEHGATNSIINVCFT